VCCPRLIEPSLTVGLAPRRELTHSLRSGYCPDRGLIVVNFGSLGLIEENENLATFTVKDWSSDCAGFGWRGADDPRGRRRHRVVEVRTLRHLLLCDLPGCPTLSS